MNKENFEKYKGKHLSVGVKHYYQPDALFFFDGIVTSVDKDGILLTKGDKEVYLVYDTIKQYHTASGSAVWQKK